MSELLEKPKKNLESKYGHSHFKSGFGINFGLREEVKLKMHVYAYTCIFRLTTSRSPKLIPKADLKWVCPYFYSNFFLKRFGQYLKKSKNGFPIVFSKSDLTGIGYIFWPNFFSEKAKHLKICLSLGGSMPDAQIKQCPLTPSPTHW